MLPGRSSDLSEPVAFPSFGDSGMIDRPFDGLTAAGTVADSHGIPFTNAAAKLIILFRGGGI